MHRCIHLFVHTQRRMSMSFCNSLIVLLRLALSLYLKLVVSVGQAGH